MRSILFFLGAIIFSGYCSAQITITAADMPVSGDTLRYSFASPATTTINPGDSGTSVVWSYSLVPTRQAVDTYKTALAVSPLYALTIGTTAYGYKIADTLTTTPVTITKAYTFFEKKTTPSPRYQAEAFAANVAGIPTPSNYTTPDVWYFFPLNYLNSDSSYYALNISLPAIGALKQTGYRKSRVDGWGTIVTPYYVTPENCIRIRSEIHEIDSITFGTSTFGIPRNSVEYKWLLNGEHYPALWVVANVVGGSETVTNIRYRDSVRYFDTIPIVDTTPIDTTPIDNKITSLSRKLTTFKAFPNPATDGLVTIDVPAEWTDFYVELFDVQSKEVGVYKNQRRIDMRSLPHGQYIARITSADQVAYVQLVR